jgi:hypothetical protein
MYEQPTKPTQSLNPDYEIQHHIPQCKCFLYRHLHLLAV